VVVGIDVQPLGVEGDGLLVPREGGREGGREGWREGGREGREGWRGMSVEHVVVKHQSADLYAPLKTSRKEGGAADCPGSQAKTYLPPLLEGCVPFVLELLRHHPVLLLSILLHLLLLLLLLGLLPLPVLLPGLLPFCCRRRRRGLVHPGGGCFFTAAHCFLVASLLACLEWEEGKGVALLAAWCA